MYGQQRDRAIVSLKNGGVKRKKRSGEHTYTLVVAGVVSGGQETRDIGQPSGERSCFDAFIAVSKSEEEFFG